MSLFGKSALKFGLPFLGFVVFGSFLLREFASIRYEVYSYKKRYGATKIYQEYDRSLNNSEIKSNVNGEKELEDLAKLGSNDDWTNIRGPRPWEDNQEYKTLVVEKIKEKAKQ